jgi:hypothetical protein
MPPDALTLRCPSCRRANPIPRRRGSPARCSRCDCELEPLALIAEAAGDISRRAVEALAAGNPAEAARLARQSRKLAPGPAASACLLLADTLLAASEAAP